MRVWNRALSGQEISDLQASNLVPQDGLVAEYLLNEGMGDTAFDTVGGHDGAVFGATWGSDINPIQVGTGRSGGGC